MHFYRTLILLLFFGVSIFSSYGQDRYSVNINYGKSHAALDSVIMRELREGEEENGDIYDGLYQHWSDTKVNPYGMNIQDLPNGFAIDCSGYYPPCLGYVTSTFGQRHHGFHNGIDLKVNVGDTIRAAFNGRVRVRRYNRGGYGYFLVLRHQKGLETVYGHLSKFLVGPDQEVRAGDPIALGGSTGHSTGPHLHFETRILGNPINPSKLFSFEAYVPLRNIYYVFKNETFEERIRYSGRYYVGGGTYDGSGASSKNDGNSNSNNTDKYSNVDFYTVRKGDNVTKIASKNHLSISRLCKLNNIKTSARIKPGQRLRLS